MPGVSATYLDLASQPKGEPAALFEAGTPPDVRALTGFEFRGYNQPRAAALLGIRKFTKAATPATTSPGSCGTMWSGSGRARTTSCSARRISSWPEHGSPTPTF